MLNILINAYACSPNWGSEQGMAWNWIINLANYCNLYIITEGEYRELIEEAVKKLPQKDNIHFYYNPVSDKIRKMCWNQGDWRFYYFYKKWQKSTYGLAQDIIKDNKIDIVHQLNMIGFREPGYLWKIKNIPFVWGPIGGMENIPTAYLDNTFLKQKIFVHLKNKINSYQVKYKSRVSKAINRADILIAAVEGVQYKIERYYNKRTVQINETGCYPNNSGINKENRQENGAFDILWVGKFDFRKQLSLAIKTMSLLKEKPGIRLHICGEGSKSEVNYYKELAVNLGIYNNCIWYGKIPNTEVHQLMKKCDLLFFTSIMEATSTVVLEAIGNNLPVLCFNTCGFGSVVDTSVGYTIELSNIDQSINDFSEKIKEFYDNRGILKKMSANCSDRQALLSWESKAKHMLDLYEKARMKYD